MQRYRASYGVPCYSRHVHQRVKYNLYNSLKIFRVMLLTGSVILESMSDIWIHKSDFTYNRFLYLSLVYT